MIQLVAKRLHDGDDLGSMMSDSVTITNAAPTISSLTLTPTTVYTNDIITATVTASDPDGDPVSYTWNWTVTDTSGSSSTISNTSSVINDILDGVGNFDRDDSVVLEVVASDGNSSSTYTASPITILNTPPTAFNLVIDPITHCWSGRSQLLLRVAMQMATMLLSWIWNKMECDIFIDVDVPAVESSMAILGNV